MRNLLLPIRLLSNDNLSYFDLVVYSSLYKNGWMTIKDIMNLINENGSEIKKSIKNLKNQNLIKVKKNKEFKTID